jgi:hypothetical protein
LGKPEGNRLLGRTNVFGWIILKRNLERSDEVAWAGSIWLRIGASRGFCEHGNEPSGSVNCWEVLEELHYWRFLMKGSDP